MTLSKSELIVMAKDYSRSFVRIVGSVQMFLPIQLYTRTPIETSVLRRQFPEHLKVVKSETIENTAVESIIAHAEARQEKFNLVDVMHFRVTAECLSIFNVNGPIRKTRKSNLVEKLHMKSLNVKQYTVKLL